MSTIPIEMFYSLFIVGLFGRRLFMINLARINEQKTKKYANRVRSATIDIIKEHKEQIKLKLNRNRSMSSDDVNNNNTDQNEEEHEEEHDDELSKSNTPTNTVTATNTMTNGIPSPRSMSLSPLNGHHIKKISQRSITFNNSLNSNWNPHSLSKSGSFGGRISGSSIPRHSDLIHSDLNKLSEAPSLRQRKSINMVKFNKQNKELLDKYQLSMIDTAARYTVLSSVAFITSLSCTAIIATMKIMYDSSDHWKLTSTLNIRIIILFILGFNAFLSDLCVLLHFAFSTKLYHSLCCCCSVCCTGCFMYCSIRRIMITVEDELTEQVKAECDAIHNQHTINDGHGLRLDLNDEDENHHTNHMNHNHNKLSSDQFKLQSVHSNSTVSVSATPPTKIAMQLINSSTPYQDIIEGTQKNKKKNIKPLIMGITVTSPDNKDIVIMKNKTDHPPSPLALRKKYGLDLHFNRTTTLQRMQTKSDDEDEKSSDNDLYYKSLNTPKQQTPQSLHSSKSSKYAEGSVAAILSSLEQEEAEMTDDELTVYSNEYATKSKRHSLSTAL